MVKSRFLWDYIDHTWGDLWVLISGILGHESVMCLTSSLVDVYIYIYIWLVVSTPLKNISQLGWLVPIYAKIKNVPNHQPDIYIHTSIYGYHLRLDQTVLVFNQQQTALLEGFFTDKAFWGIDLANHFLGIWLDTYGYIANIAKNMGTWWDIMRIHLEVSAPDDPLFVPRLLPINFWLVYQRCFFSKGSAGILTPMTWFSPRSPGEKFQVHLGSFPPSHQANSLRATWNVDAANGSLGPAVSGSRCWRSPASIQSDLEMTGTDFLHICWKSNRELPRICDCDFLGGLFLLVWPGGSHLSFFLGLLWFLLVLIDSGRVVIDFCKLKHRFLFFSSFETSHRELVSCQVSEKQYNMSHNSI